MFEGSAGPFATRGGLSDWKAGVGRLVSGHSRGVLMVSASLSAPLLALAGLDGGGVHLVGSSSCGKSTLLEAAASCWGRGSLDGFVRTWRATANALEGTAAYHNDVALPLDELGVVDPRDAATAVYQLAGGQGKGRSRKDGSLRESQTWRVMILSTGEVRLADKIVEGRQRAMAGQMVRLLDVPADAGKGAGAFDGVGTFQSPKVLSELDQTSRSKSLRDGRPGIRGGHTQRRCGRPVGPLAGTHDQVSRVCVASWSGWADTARSRPVWLHRSGGGARHGARDRSLAARDLKERG